MNLAVFTDQVYAATADAISTDESYILFPLSFADLFDRVEFIGRVDGSLGCQPYVISRPRVTFCEIPYYTSVPDLYRRGPRFKRALIQVFQANLHKWDVVWITGPNPVANCLAQVCADEGKPFFLVVRQNLPQQIGHVYTGLRGVAARGLALLLEKNFRRLARNRTVFAVGQEIGKAYAAVTPRTHIHFPSLITDQQVLELARVVRQPLRNRLLCVGRLAPEKGHSYLISALSRLKAEGTTCTLDIVGSGPLEASLKGQANSLHLNGDVQFHGYVPFGPDLFSFYRRAAAVVLPSLSEGLPQVIMEALASRVPIVATTVGGIPGLLTHGQNGMLVPPANSAALAGALRRLLHSEALQTHLTSSAKFMTPAFTLESQRNQMAQIIKSEVFDLHPCSTHPPSLKMKSCPA